MCQNHQYLIICGTSKAATTSVFNYIADHPDVCGSNVKQTNYFLDTKTQKKFNLLSTHKYESNFNNYKNYYKDLDKNFLLEASPDYMYDMASIDRLKEFSKTNKTKLIFILRDPVTRFESWFNFGKQQGKIKSETSFEEFYKLAKTYTNDSDLSLLAYQTGFYSVYLKKILKQINKNEILFLFYEDLKSNPLNFINNLCSKVGLDSSFYKSYTFSNHNKTIETKFKFLNKIYNSVRMFYLMFFNKGKIGVMLGQYLKSVLSPLYKKINTKDLSVQPKDFKTKKLLEQDYEAEKLELIKLIGNTPW